jgi:SAM-dependent methyltransferase
MDLNELPATPFRRHPWEVARARFFAGVVASVNPIGGPLRAMDIGAGDAYLARHVLQGLPAGSTMTCVDANYSELDMVRLATPPLPGLTFARARPAGRHDVVMMLDVIEHVPDDRAFLDEILESNLQPGGTAVVSVPAWDLLYGPHDVALKHYRRYQPGQCRALLRAAGLHIVRDGGLFHSLLVPRILQRMSEVATGALRRGLGANAGGADADRPPHLGEWSGGPLLSSVVTMALDADTRLTAQLARRGVGLPGLSYWALGRKASA